MVEGTIEQRRKARRERMVGTGTLTESQREVAMGMMEKYPVVFSDSPGYRTLADVGMRGEGSGEGRHGAVSRRGMEMEEEGVEEMKGGESPERQERPVGGLRGRASLRVSVSQSDSNEEHLSRSVDRLNRLYEEEHYEACQLRELRGRQEKVIAEQALKLADSERELDGKGKRVHELIEILDAVNVGKANMEGDREMEDHKTLELLRGRLTAERELVATHLRAQHKAEEELRAMRVNHGCRLVNLEEDLRMVKRTALRHENENKLYKTLIFESRARATALADRVKDLEKEVVRTTEKSKRDQGALLEAELKQGQTQKRLELMTRRDEEVLRRAALTRRELFDLKKRGSPSQGRPPDYMGPSSS